MIFAYDVIEFNWAKTVYRFVKRSIVFSRINHFVIQTSSSFVPVYIHDIRRRMSLKVYLHLEEPKYPEKTSKIDIPASWGDKPVSKVIELFANAYNKKNPDNALELLDEIHLVDSEQHKIYSDDLVKDVLNDRNDYYLKFGAYIRRPKKDEVDTSNLLKCRNYGCNQHFSEDQNHDNACQHHTGPPIFHDTMKCWSCCRDRKAYDFEGFQAITGCATGRHSTVPQTVAISASPNAVDPATVFKASQPALKSISEFNATNPTAVSSITSAVKTLEIRKSTRNEDGVTAKCQRKGCQKVFNIADNSAESCTHHKGQPIFHDAAKFWSCCPEKKCYDFEEFLAVPGCTVGYHDDGVIDLETGNAEK